MGIANLINKFSVAIRTNHWWKYKAAHILGFMYFFFFLIQPKRLDALILFLLSTTTIVGIAGLGYFINDLYDIEFDLKAGKRNHVGELSVVLRLLVFLILVGLAFLPWIYLKSSVTIWILIAAELLLFWIYAHPISRLKEKAQWGLICDALYGHAMPVVIASLTYWQYYAEKKINAILFFLLLFSWQFVKGIRNILLHQLTDYQNDVKSGVKTYTSIGNPNKVYRFVLYRLVPLEFFWNLFFIILVYDIMPTLLYGFLLFLGIFIAGHGLFRNIKYHKTIYEDNTYLYFLNDWYEDYFPFTVLLSLIFYQPNLWPLAIGHILLFPSAFQCIFLDLKSAIQQLYFFLFDIKRWLGFEEKE